MANSECIFFILDIKHLAPNYMKHLDYLLNAIVVCIIVVPMSLSHGSEPSWGRCCINTEQNPPQKLTIEVIRQKETDGYGQTGEFKESTRQLLPNHC